MDEVITALWAAVRDEVAAQLCELRLELKRELVQLEPAAVSSAGGDSADGILTAREAADYASCHWLTITDACRAGDLREYQRTHNATWKVLREDVDEWLGVKPFVRRGHLRAV